MFDEFYQFGVGGVQFIGWINQFDNELDCDCSNIENIEQIQKLQVGEGEVFCCQWWVFWSFRCFIVIGFDCFLDDDCDDQYQVGKLEGSQWCKNVFEVVEGEFQGVMFLLGEMSEKVGQDEEQQYLEDVWDVEGQCEIGIVVVVMGDLNWEVVWDE